MKKQVTIIGAGASGMTAAIFAARQGAQVTLLEHMDRVGTFPIVLWRKPVTEAEWLIFPWR